MDNSELTTNEIRDSIYNRLRTIGQVGRVLCTIILAMAVVALILGALCVLQADHVAFQFGIIALGESTGLWGKVAVIAADAALWIFVVLAVWMARRLFANFVRGNVLTFANGRLLRWMGVWCFFAAAPVLAPDGVIFGFFLLALGWAMELAATIREEQELTI